MKDLTLEIIQSCYNSMAKTYSTDMLKATHSLLNDALSHAEGTGKIKRNWAAKAKIPKAIDSDDGKDVKALGDDELKKFLNRLSERSSKYMIIYFMVQTGLRPGEAIALQRRDINFTAGTTDVKKTYIEKTKTIQDNTKTKTSK